VGVTAGVGTLCVSTAMKKVILARSAKSLRRLRHEWGSSDRRYIF